jgi:hypothetical protein
VSTVPAGTPVLSGPGQPLGVGLGDGVVGLGAGVVDVGAGVVGEGDGVPVGTGELVGLGEGLGHFGFGTHEGRMPRP